MTQILINHQTVKECVTFGVFGVTFKNNTLQNISDEKCSRLMFKLSSSCNHTSSKSLSPFSNDFVDDVLIQLMPMSPQCVLVVHGRP